MARKSRSIDTKKNEAILAAASQLLLAHGYENTSMDAVALQAGVTKQTVYSHFKCKDQLFIAVITQLCQRRVGQANLEGMMTRPFEELLFEVGMNLLTLITSPDGIAMTRLVVADTGQHPELTRLYYENGTQRVVKLIAEFLDLQVKRKVIRIPNTLSAAAYFFALLKGEYFLRKALGVPPIPSAKAKAVHVREVVAIFMLLYGGDRPLKTMSAV